MYACGIIFLTIRNINTHAMSTEGWCVHHMDVESAFLNGELQEEVFVKQPLSYVQKGHEQKVLHLGKTLYGLRQVSCTWYAKLDASLLSLGFHRSDSEHVVGVYAHDPMFTSGNQVNIDQFKLDMKGTFQTSNLGPLHYYLGLEVTWSTTGITANQVYNQHYRKPECIGGKDS